MPKSTALTIAIVGLILLLFGYFFWPTPYLYYQVGDAPTVIRVSRFSGRTEYSTDKGWQTQQEIQEASETR